MRDVDDRRKGVDAEGAEIADRERAAGELLRLELLRRGRGPSGRAFARQFRAVPARHVAEHGREQTGRRVDGDRNVDAVGRNDLAVDPLPIERRVFLEGPGDELHDDIG